MYWEKIFANKYLIKYLNLKDKNTTDTKQYEKNYSKNEQKIGIEPSPKKI
jgi:hypothetical protein